MTTEYDRELTIDRSRNEHFIHLMEERVEKYELCRMALVRPFVGRVSLCARDADLGEQFYVGSWGEEWRDVKVVSWASEAASLFYTGTWDDRKVPPVAKRRTYSHRGHDLANYIDEPMPAPPSDVQAHESLRAGPIVNWMVDRPRTGSLHTVLGSLQPDQYELMTADPDRVLMVRGQPGTGKTIIATHRACYLSRPERGAAASTRIALIGPSEQYQDHVASTLDNLMTDGSSERITVYSIPRLIAAVSGSTRPLRIDDGDEDDTAEELDDLLQESAALLGQAGVLRGDMSTKQRVLVEAVLQDHGPARAAVDAHPRLDGWLARLRETPDAWALPKYAPFFAAATLAAGQERPFQFDHIVVDEAQDLRPLEWRIILGLLRPGASVSIFGDMNQQMSRTSPMTWSRLSRLLSLQTGKEVEAVDLSVAFRSTQRILDFANKLLPASRRRSMAIREGTSPRIIVSTSLRLYTDAAAEAEGLAEWHRGGLVAIIAMQPKSLSSILKARGYSSSNIINHGWKKGQRNIVVLHPRAARGLEFDGVVVVEPAQIPRGENGAGLLYTSLTRATKELVIVHAKPLPARLAANGPR